MTPNYTDRDIHRMVEEAGDELIQFPHAFNEEHNIMLNGLVRQLAVLDDIIIKRRALDEIDASRTTGPVRSANYMEWLKYWREF